MERQFHLYCASACTNVDGFETDSIEWGTIENGVIERKKYVHEIPTSEPTSDEGGDEEPVEE